MPQELLPTHFAPSERLDIRLIREDFAVLERHFIAQTLDALPVITLLLNDFRQIVLANAQTLKTTGAGIDDILGKRPGEAFGCVHVKDGPGGCGTSRFCSRCGAVRSIILGLEGRKDVQDCNLLRMADNGVEALDLQVSSSPIEVEGRSYVLFCIQDLSDLKRRRTLERLFFHDMLNTVGGLRGLAEILSQDVPDAFKEDAGFIHSTLTQLTDELLAQKDLLAAENNELTPVFTLIRSRSVLDWAARMGASLPQASGKTLEVPPESDDVEFTNDPTLVRRVLGNMVKNALEASGRGDAVKLSCRLEGGGVRFTVANPAVMSEDVRLRVFNRNFSTKGLGRGLGAYGMKLLSERYMGGVVSFTSRAPEGTMFHLFLPLDPGRGGNGQDRLHYQ
ncbi:MAG: sensor histidine kinase [Thermodesulfobacteriota bacterium]